MRKAVSFASALDPAFLIGSDKGEGSSRQTRASSFASSSRIHSDDGNTNEVVTTEELAVIRKRSSKEKAKMTEMKSDLVHSKKIPARLQIVPAGESPLFQTFLPTPVEDVGDISESIYDVSTTSAPWEKALDKKRRSNADTLARSLFEEKEQQDFNQKQDSKQRLVKLERRTSYGSKRRRLERQSRRSIRNADKSIEIDREPHPSSSAIVSSLSQNDAETIKEGIAFSQQSHLSIESDDGVYQTQFSFFHFESEHDEVELHETGNDELSRKSAEDRDSSTESLKKPTQLAYDADRSASWTDSSYRSSMNRQEEVRTKDPNPKHVSPGNYESTVKDLTDDPNTKQNSPAIHEFDQLPTIGENTTEHKLVKELCLKSDENIHKPRSVHPTIWKGNCKIQEYFGPLLNPYTPARSPPARDDVRRWVEWQDSESDHEIIELKKPELYNYKGKLSDIPSWSDDSG